MPEGHTLHRLARTLDRAFAGRRVRASSPQGRFADGAALLDGMRLERAQAHGKHLLVGFEDPDRVLHVHLGLYGKFPVGAGEAPEVRGALRLRLTTVEPAGSAETVEGRSDPDLDTDLDVGGTREPAWAELRGPTACEVYGPADVAVLLARLGPDPLRPDPRGVGAARFTASVRASRTAVGALLMRQDLVAGVGNIYRAEALFRAGVHPWRPGREVSEEDLAGIWSDLVVLMRAGVRAGKIITTERGHRSRPGGAVRREDAHYVYKRTGLPCRLCGTPVLAGEMVARSVFWCPTCQPA